MKVMEIGINGLVLIMFVALVFLTGLIIGYIEVSGSQSYGFHKEMVLKLVTNRTLLLGAFGILGMLTRVLFDEIQASRQRYISILAILKKTLRYKGFWLAILTCPLILGFISKQYIDVSDKSAFAFIAYQNGFFWNSVFIAIQKTHESNLKGKSNEKK